MQRDDVLKIANDMAFMACIWIDDEGNEVNDLVKFAELVAAKERERCAARAAIALLGTLKTTSDRVLKAIRNTSHL